MTLQNLNKILDRYEQQLGSTDMEHKHLWIKKATGLGITEFMLRYMAWLCLRDRALEGSQMCIVTGPRIELAITLIDRIKLLFTKKDLKRFNSKETIIELNGVHIEAYPSHHLDAMRGLSRSSSWMKQISFLLGNSNMQEMSQRDTSQSQTLG